MQNGEQLHSGSDGIMVQINESPEQGTEAEGAQFLDTKQHVVQHCNRFCVMVFGEKEKSKYISQPNLFFTSAREVVE